MMPVMASERPIDLIIRRFGSTYKLASALGCGQSVIAGWKKRGHIPGDRQQEVLDAARAKGIALEPADFFERSESSGDPGEAAA
jgi:hypothetical protein